MFDPCFERVKEAFAKAYPGLPKNLYTPIDGEGYPEPKYVKELPPHGFPAYAGRYLLYVPYRLPTSSFPMYVPFHYRSAQLAIKEFPLLLPFSQLTASQPKYGREYPVYLPFMSEQVKKNSGLPCGSFIHIPFPAGKKEFYRYKYFRLDIPDVEAGAGAAAAAAAAAAPAPEPEPKFNFPKFTPALPFIPKPAPIIPVAFPSPKIQPLLPQPIPAFPMKQFDMGPVSEFGSFYEGPQISPGAFAPAPVLHSGNFDDYASYGSFSSGFISGGEAFSEVKPVSGFPFRPPMAITAPLTVSGSSGISGKNMPMFYYIKNEVGFETL